jgi:hypothetical protein
MSTDVAIRELLEIVARLVERETPLTLNEAQAFLAGLAYTGKFEQHVTELLLTAAATAGDLDEGLPDMLREHLR